MASWQHCLRHSSPPAIRVLALFGFAACVAAAAPVLGGEPRCPKLALMLNKSNPVQELSLNDLSEIFLGKKTRWPSGGKILVIAAADDSKRAGLFNQQVLGSFRRPRTVADSPLPFRPLLLGRLAAREYVRLFRNAIAYGWYNPLVKDVKWLEVEGLNPSSRKGCRKALRAREQRLQP